MKNENDRKQRLINLGAETLAEALLECAVYSSTVDDRIEQLIATPEENVKRFKKKLSSIKRSKRYIDWRQAPEYSRELIFILQSLKTSVTDPLTGVELVAAFYETDSSILGRCDDSNGYFGDLFRFDAADMFAHYASRCTDKEKIANIILKLNQKDDYAVRDSLINCANEFLPEEIIRTMITALQKRAETETGNYGFKRSSALIESLARQIKDAQLYETTRIASRGGESVASCIDIAQVYLESGNVDTAHAWLKKIPEHEKFKATERDKLLQEIYEQQGDTETLQNLLHKKFKSEHSISSLQALLNVIGQDKRDTVVNEEIEHIMKSTTLQVQDIQFLIEIGKFKEAEDYLFNRAEQIDGNFYEVFLPLAKSFESKKYYLASSLIFRSLLLSILDRKFYKAYPYAASYLKKLDKLSEIITNWKNFDSHEAFKEQLLQAHERKKRFWSEYEEKL